MSNTDVTLTPAETWTRCATAMADASLQFTVQATSAAFNMWGGPPLIQPSAAPTANRPVRASEPEQKAFKPWAPEAWALEAWLPQFPKLDSQAAEPASTASRSRSWYRAPYRTPFDPLFWAEPDTSRTPFSSPSWMPNLGAWPQQAGLSNFAHPLSSLMPPAFANFAPLMQPVMPNAMPHLMTAAWQPIFANWMSAMSPMMPQVASAMSASPFLPGRTNRSPTVPDPSLFSAYRSSGGFAVAQAFMDTARQAPQAQNPPTLAWFKLAFPWMPH